MGCSFFLALELAASWRMLRFRGPRHVRPSSENGAVSVHNQRRKRKTNKKRHFQIFFSLRRCVNRRPNRTDAGLLNEVCALSIENSKNGNGDTDWTSSSSSSPSSGDLVGERDGIVGDVSRVIVVGPIFSAITRSRLSLNTSAMKRRDGPRPRPLPVNCFFNSSTNGVVIRDNVGRMGFDWFVALSLIFRPCQR